MKKNGITMYKALFTRNIKVLIVDSCTLEKRAENRLKTSKKLEEFFITIKCFFAVECVLLQAKVCGS